jgi:hypothetical protein|uniref:hypothetical protein n=2 Tax=Flavobacterium sp. TaxID=239 RepID=UPI00404AA4CA
MKKLEINQMEVLNGEGVGTFVNGVCLGATIYALGAGAGLVAAVAISNPVGWGLGAFCAANAIGTGFGWWD